MRRVRKSEKIAKVDSPLRNISDTARWMAVYRARESRRPDAAFHDPFAERLAGERGEQIAALMPFAEKNSWPFVARTWLFDQLISEQLRQGAGMVVNLAAGLDARPYRLDLPPSLQWVEVDLPEILEHKELVLRGEKPVCRLERFNLDLSEPAARRELFKSLGKQNRNALILAEGLLVYLSETEVGSLARDLSAESSFRHWILDLASPALLGMLKKRMSGPLDQAGLPFRFAPKAGPDFFRSHGWEPEQAHPVIQAALRLKRLPLFVRLLARLSSPRFRPNRPWSAVCLFSRQSP